MKTKHLFAHLIVTCLLSVATAPLSWADTLPAGPDPVDLGSAVDYVILSKAGISTTGVTSIIGDIAVSPNDSTSLTGFSLSLDSTTRFSTSPQVTGRAFAPDYANPTPSNLTTAIHDMETAFTDAAGRTLPDATELGAGNISGMTISPGLYKWGSGVLITSGVTLEGSADDIWIFQISQNLTIENGASISLSGGALAGNIFWQVAGGATIGTTAHFEGNLLCQTAIDVRTGATINGRLLAQTAVTLDSNIIVQPEDVNVWSRGASILSGGWKYLEWFGYFYDGEDGWIWHKQLGWLYMVGDSPASIWMWTSDMGWLWTSNANFPGVYRAIDSAWLWFSQNPNTPSLFYNFKTRLWESR